MGFVRVLACLLCLGALCPSAASAATHWYGFNDSSVTAGQISAVGAASISQSVGADSARITLNWAWVQPTNGAANFSTFDAIYHADIADGIRPLITLVGSPSWAWAAGTTCSTGGCVYPPAVAHDSDWQRFTAEVATRYPRAAGIEIWNEPNMSWEWSGGIDPARYTDLLKLAYAAIKRVNPNMPVIAGSLAANLSTTVTTAAYPMVRFLRAMYRNGAKGHMNGISIHPYPGAVDLFYAYKAISDATQTRDANRDGVPLWITETGLSTQSFSQAQQADTDAELFRALEAYRKLAGVYLATLVDPPTGGDGLGTITSSLSVTPAFCSVASVLHGSYVCPPTVPTATPSLTQRGRWRAQTLLQYAADAAIRYWNPRRTFADLTSKALHRIDRRISAIPATDVPAGIGAVPNRIRVYPLSRRSVLLCNASAADRSYCTGTVSPGGWNWWQSTGSAHDAAYVAMRS